MLSSSGKRVALVRVTSWRQRGTKSGMQKYTTYAIEFRFKDNSRGTVNKRYSDFKSLLSRARKINEVCEILFVNVLSNPLMCASLCARHPVTTHPTLKTICLLFSFGDVLFSLVVGFEFNLNPPSGP
jgi:hypothetical protein